MWIKSPTHHNAIQIYEIKLKPTRGQTQIAIANLIWFDLELRKLENCEVLKKIVWNFGQPFIHLSWCDCSLATTSCTEVIFTKVRWSITLAKKQSNASPDSNGKSNMIREYHVYCNI